MKSYLLILILLANVACFISEMSVPFQPAGASAQAASAHSAAPAVTPHAMESVRIAARSRQL